MSANQIIALSGIIMSAVVAVHIGYLQRKQMRQIEAYRSNPAVGLIPSQSAPAKWISMNKGLLKRLSIPIVVLVAELLSNKPVTRWSIVVIAMAFSTIVLFLVTDLFRVLMNGIAELFRIYIEETEKVTGALKSLEPSNTPKNPA